MTMFFMPLEKCKNLRETSQDNLNCLFALRVKYQVVAGYLRTKIDLFQILHTKSEIKTERYFLAPKLHQLSLFIIYYRNIYHFHTLLVDPAGWRGQKSFE